MEKRCSKCGEWKPLEEFHKHTKSSDGHDSWCKECKLASDARRRGRDPEAVAAMREKYKSVDVQQIYERYERGDFSKKIAKDLGVSVTYVVDKLTEKYGTSKSWTPFQREVRALFESGLCSVEIADATGSNINRVNQATKALGLKFSDEQRERSKRLGMAKQPGPDEQSIIRWVEALGQYEYLGGYTNSNGYVTIRCKICGKAFEKACVTIRQGHIRCPGCVEARQQKREEERRLKADQRNQDRLERKAKRETEDALKTKTKVCVECGQTFITRSGSAVCCSPECRRKRQNRKHSETKIPLRLLYERDNGVCYICGKRCSFDDYQIINENFIVGQTYPTVEHVIPRCQGGPDAWDNVKLACHACNSAKGTKSLVKMERSGQIALVI